MLKIEITLKRADTNSFFIGQIIEVENTPDYIYYDGAVYKKEHVYLSKRDLYVITYVWDGTAHKL